MNTVWIDATHFFKRKPPLSGIPRVEAELVKWAQNNLGNVKLFEFHPVSKCFTVFHEEPLVVKPAPLPLPALKKELPPSSGGFIIKPSFGEVKLYAKAALVSLYRLLLSFINIQYRPNVHFHVKNTVLKFDRCYWNFKKKRGHPPATIKISSSDQNSPLLKYAHPFKDGDSILFAGTAWEYKEINDEIFSLKKNIKLSIYIICHDIIPIKFPHLCFQVKGIPLNEKFLPYFLGMTKIADQVFCVSKSTEADYRKFTEEMRLACPKTSVITEGSHIVQAAEFKPPASVIQEFLKTEFVLFVSTLERRKNHECIYKAILYLLESGLKNLPKFLFVGKPGWSVDELLSDLKFDLRIKNHIVLMHGITDDHDLKFLYEKALFSLYPSFYEGWGLPVAESLNYGKMAIVSSTSSMPEVGHDFVDYIHPYDTLGWANRIAFYLNNRDELAKKEKYIRENYKKNSWEDFCKQIFNKITAGE